MTDRQRNFRLYGTHSKECASRLLAAGDLTAQFENGNLRAIKFGGVEILRAISYLVRDRDWGTYDPVLSDLDIDERDSGFTISYSALCAGPGPARLGFKAMITGTPDGMMFDVTAIPESDFGTNRCGFCILHPVIGLAGSDVKVEHVDGSIVESRLPDLIDPWQPFKNMRAITHQVSGGVFAECRMDGDTFEMEDQRNWSDASYKTYVRPLELPWPYILRAGLPVRQTITLSINGNVASARSERQVRLDGIVLSRDGLIGAMPGIGLVIAPEDINGGTAGVIKAVKPQSLLLHFDPDAGHGLAALQAFAALTSTVSSAATLELALPCKRCPKDELQEMAAWVRASGLSLAALIVSPSVDRQSTPPGSKWPDCPPLDEVYAAARAAFPDLKLGGGMLSYFTELNRKRAPAETLDLITHATNPIVHAADDISVMQTLEALPFITRSVRAIYGSRPYHIGPSTIAMRQNPYGSATKPNPDMQRMPMANRDPRHNGLFGAAWTAGYAAQIIDARPAMLTLSAATGPFGLMAGPGEPVAESGMRPLFHVIKWLAAHAGWQSAQCHSSDGARAVCMLATSPAGKRAAVIANLTAEPIKVDMGGLGFGVQDALAVLDALNLSPASQKLTADSLALDAFAVAFLAGDTR